MFVVNRKSSFFGCARGKDASTALSDLFSLFRYLPCVCCYDNAYNMLKSEIQRVPWFCINCLIVWDWVHYKSHTCNSIFDPHSFVYCSEHATFRVESVNHFWILTKSNLRLSRISNVIPFTDWKLHSSKQVLGYGKRISDINMIMLKDCGGIIKIASVDVAKRHVPKRSC